MRALDIVISSIALVLLSPALLLIALAIRFTSPGPALYSQARVGRGGRTFRLLKFRSMRSAMNGAPITADDDRRITPVGRFLRHRKLDELPQLVNVLRGDMSLVGPRPEVPEFVAHYTEEQKQVLSVRPGLTGAATLAFRHEEKLLAGRPNVVDYYLAEVMPAKLEIELRYLRQRSLLTDVLLLLRTVRVVLTGE